MLDLLAVFETFNPVDATHLLCKLHWLLVWARIDDKRATLCYSCPHSLVQYIGLNYWCLMIWSSLFSLHVLLSSLCHASDRRNSKEVSSPSYGSSFFSILCPFFKTVSMFEAFKSGLKIFLYNKNISYNQAYYTTVNVCYNDIHLLIQQNLNKRLLSHPSICTI